MSTKPLLEPPIKFGTDGWRGIIADDFTFARLATVAPVAAQVLAETFGRSSGSNTIIVGYDRRFLSEEFAKRTAEVVAAAGFDVLLADSFAPTPAFSWAAFDRKALGALVITASHNPASYSGLKIKGAFGGSVSPEITSLVEAKLSGEDTSTVPPRPAGTIAHFDAWQSYCEVLRSKVDLGAIKQAISSGNLAVFVDVMHGAAAGGLAKILELETDSQNPNSNSSNLMELNANADPLFGGGAPEPLPRYISSLFKQIRAYHHANPDKLSVGFVFDGDADRIAAVDREGNFLSSQVLIPVLIDHLAKSRGWRGEVIKTISGMDLMPKVAALHDLPVFETAVGYKYIGERMMSGAGGDIPALLGGEESGGIGYGTHIPERDALLSALYLLEAIALTKRDLSQIYLDLQQQTNYFSHYDRIDKHLASLAVKDRVVDSLTKQPLVEVDGRKVVDVLAIDGFKLRLEDGSWLLIRFSGTEPVLRLYCEAATPELVRQTLAWISVWADQFSF